MVDGIISIIVTVVSGVLVFIVGQILTSVWLKPLQEYKEIKRKISYQLVFYANVYSNPIDLAKYKDSNSDAVLNYKSVSEELRKSASELAGFIEILSFIKIGIPKKKNLHNAYKNMIGLSNSLFLPYNCICDNEERRNIDEYVKNIKNALNIR